MEEKSMILRPQRPTHLRPTFSLSRSKNVKHTCVTGISPPSSYVTPTTTALSSLKPTCPTISPNIVIRILPHSPVHTSDCFPTPHRQTKHRPNLFVPIAPNGDAMADVAPTLVAAATAVFQHLPVPLLLRVPLVKSWSKLGFVLPKWKTISRLAYHPSMSSLTVTPLSQSSATLTF